MITKADKNATRKNRHARVRAKLYGTAERPRFNVFRSKQHIYAHVIDDVNGVTLVNTSTYLLSTSRLEQTTSNKQLKGKGRT